MSEVDICVPFPFKNHFYDSFHRSLEKYNAGVDYNLIEVIADKTIGENYHTLFEQRKSPYVLMCDWDIEFIHDGWLYNLLTLLKEEEPIGSVTATEYWKDPTPTLENKYVQGLFPVGYCSLFSKDLKLKIDRTLRACMDLDIGYQVAAQKKVCVVTSNAIVKHKSRTIPKDKKLFYLRYPDYERADRLYLILKWAKEMEHPLLWNF